MNKELFQPISVSRMARLRIVAFVALALMTLTGCADSTRPTPIPTAVTFSNICDDALNGKRVSIVGYVFLDRPTTQCGTQSCWVRFYEKQLLAGAFLMLPVDTSEYLEKNRMDPPPAVYDDGDLKLYLNDGILANNNKVMITGDVHRFSNAGPGVDANALGCTLRNMVFEEAGPVTSTLDSPITAAIKIPYCDETIPSLPDKSTYLCLSSEPNDPLGDGKSLVITPEQGNFSVTAFETNGDINVSVDLSQGGWNMGFAPPENQPWNLGLYENAKAFTGSQPLPKIQIAMSQAEGESCFGESYGENSLIMGSGSGNFELLEYSRTDDQVDHLAINFEFRCKNVDAKLKGYLRFHSIIGQ